MINILYSVYNHLLNFEFSCFNIGFIGFISFFGFYGMKSFIIIVTIILEAEIARNVLDNKSVICVIRSGERKKEKKGSMNLFIVIIVIGLDDIYLARFLVFLLFIFALRFVVTTFFFIVIIFAFFAAIFFV